MTEFEKFFAEDWDKLLKSVSGRAGLFSDGSDLKSASWDRKAAFLVWAATRKPPPPPAQGSLF